MTENFCIIQVVGLENWKKFLNTKITDTMSTINDVEIISVIETVVSDSAIKASSSSSSSSRDCNKIILKKENNLFKGVEVVVLCIICISAIKASVTSCEESGYEKSFNSSRQTGK